ncbi:helix-turn-helix domain-containing protein [Sphingomonas sp. SRS2]|uniref:helix-turn-helix domain-containing protein n=1 Tax=Sphingomonas sp. SRS2 TaxID=133190 RepID=UPI0006967786|nr:helix-turn-helix transcriptional regulator [Sphingomonas sp. SRS2]
MEFGTDEKEDDRAHVALLTKAVQSIRKSRRMKPSEVAAAMGLPVRTYEHFERGTGKVSYARIVRFAHATDSDPIAILAALLMRSTDFALHCADNKLMTIIIAAFRRLDEELGPDISYLSPSILVSALEKLCNDLIGEVRRRDQFAERWMEENVSKVAGAAIRGKRPKTT